MELQYQHKVTSSALLWLENKVLDKGQAFTNHSGFFYDIKDVYNGRFTYSLPYQPLVADKSITSAIIMSGIFLDRTFITSGQSGLTGINYQKAQVYFISEITGANTRISGEYSIADFNVKLTSEPEETLLFEPKHA